MQAITPGDDIYDYRFNLQKRSNLIPTKSQKYTPLPIIKAYKDQMIGTEDIKTCIDFNYRQNQNIKETTTLSELFKQNPSMTSINNMITYSNNVIKANLNFNRKNKLKSIQKPLTKSHSTSNINIIDSTRTLSVINIPSKIHQNKILKHSSSLPKLNIKKEYFENNKCNYLVLKYTGRDNSKNELKKKKYLVINSHKVINSLKSYSMPNDIYGTKLIDVIQQRINSGFYRNYQLNVNYTKKYQTIQIKQGTNYELKPKPQPIKKEEEKKFDGTFLKDIYDKFLLPGPDNKYNYTVHKIFLSQILEKVCKKMVEIRDKNNKVVTKEEIRQEYSNEVDNLRKSLLTGKDFRIINNVYNINNKLNIISIDLGKNPLLNDMGIIDESQERSETRNAVLEESEINKQSMTSHLFNIFNKNINDEKDRKENLAKIESKYKSIHKEENTRLLSFIKDTINIQNESSSFHDSFMNLYLNKIKTPKHNNERTSYIIRSKKRYTPSFTETRSYFQQEEELNNVDKFILNTKKLRHTLNIREKSLDKGKHLSLDSEGNINNSFEKGLKLNPVFFDDIYDELQEQYNKNNNIDTKIAQNNLIKEILRFYLQKKGINLKFSDKISKKYLSMLLLKKKKEVKKRRKIQVKKATGQKEERHIIEEIGKKIHKKINIIKRKVLIDTTEIKRKKDKNKRNNTEDNFWQRNKSILKDKEVIHKKREERQLTENSYLEIETNSSEFSDIPSELDSEIFEIIRKKQEKEKKKDKDLEEGVYARKSDTGAKQKGEDFIISRPVDREAKKKEKEEEKKRKEEAKKEEKKDEKNNLSNLNMFLSIGEKAEIDEVINKNKIKKEDKKDHVNLPKKEVILKPIIPKPKTESVQKYKEIKLKPEDKKTNIKDETVKVEKIDKADKVDKIEQNKEKKEEPETKIISKKQIKNKENININKKQNKKELEKITEEENKKTDLSNKLKEDTKKRKSEIILPKNIKKEKSVVSLYKNIKIEGRKSTIEKGSNEDNSGFTNNNDLKNMVPTIEEKNNINDSSINPTTDQLSIMGVINSINNKEKTPANISNIQKSEQKGKEVEFQEDDEEIDVDIIKAKIKRSRSFYNNRRSQRLKLAVIDVEEKHIQQTKRGNSASLDPNKNYKKIKYFLDKYNEENVKKEDDYELETYEEKIFELEENEEQKEARKKRKMKRKTNTSNKDFRKFFIDENIKKEETAKKMPEKEVEVEPQKEIWEDKFKQFKLYIHKLKGMNQKEFKSDLFKFLQEEEKIDFTQKEKLNKVDRINKYKAFITNSKLNKLKYNRFHSSHILFAHGCIFNTGGLLPE